MKIEGTKVLVTGAGGFIGSHLVEALAARGARVTAMLHYDSRSDSANLEFVPEKIRNSIEVVAGNIEDPYFVSSVVRGKDLVFHLAALIAIPFSYIAPASFVSTNVMGTLAVLEACRTHRISRLVHTSTSETYGTAQYTPIDEKHPLQGQSPYSASKISADKLAESYYLSYELPVSTVRPFNTFGPRQSARAVIPTIISQALFSSRIRLGSLFPVRDLNFVLDTIEGFIATAESDATVGKVINIGSGSAISIGDLVNIIQDLTETKKAVVTEKERIRPEKSEVLQLICNHSLATSLTGWKPRYTLRQGIQATISFVKNNRYLFHPERYSR